MGYDADLDFQFTAPTKVVFGAGSVRDLGAEVAALGASRAFLVTDRGLAAHTDLPARAEAGLGSRHVGTFTDVEPESSAATIEAAADAARAAGADAIVSLGGGSAMDTAKGVAILLTEGGRIGDHVGLNALSRPTTPHLAVPTTAGTGSEVTYAFLFSDGGRKTIIADLHVLPRTAVLDPTLTVGLPAPLTAGTGMDALTHAVEAIHSLQASPMSDGYATHAIGLIAAHLPTAVHEPTDLHARGQMLIASLMAGIAFSNAQVGIVHAMAHGVGAHHHVHHGTANAILLAHGMRFNLADAADRYGLVARALGVGTPEAAIDAIADLVVRVGLPTRLRDVGVPEDGLPAIAEYALTDGSIVYNPRFVSEADEVLGVLQEAF